MPSREEAYHALRNADFGMSYSKLYAEKWVQQGLCLAHHPKNFKPIFIHGALPKEHVQVQIQKTRSTHSFACATEILKASPKRILHDCSAFPKCGGCSFRHIPYQEELRLKEELLSEFHYLRKCMEQSNFQMFSGRDEGYRNHVQIHATKTQKGCKGQFGFFALHSNHIIPLPKEGCKHISKELNHFIKQTLSDFPSIHGRLSFRQVGKKCYLVREKDNPAKTHKKTSYAPFSPAPEFLCEKIQFSDGSRLYWEFASRGFWQANRFLLPLWLEKIRQTLYPLVQKKNKEQSPLHAIELFCGSGLIGGALYAKGLLKSYTGIENSPLALEAARRNFKTLNFPANFIKKDICKLFGIEDRAKNFAVSKANLLIANPPRAGLPKNFSAWIRNSKIKHILYSSCNPATLNRDLKKLIEEGFVVQNIFAFDFFPRTWHLELVLLLTRESPCA